MRHGETAWNVDARIQGQLDIQLNDTGRWQAERVGWALATEPLSAVYSSDLGRAHETARRIAERVGQAVVPHQGLRERRFHVRQFAGVEGPPAEQQLVAPRCPILEQIGQADHDQRDERRGGHARAGAHRAQQLYQLGVRLVDEIHPWILSWGRPPACHIRI